MKRSSIWIEAFLEAQALVPTLMYFIFMPNSFFKESYLLFICSIAFLSEYFSWLAAKIIDNYRQRYTRLINRLLVFLLTYQITFRVLSKNSLKKYAD